MSVGFGVSPQKKEQVIKNYLRNSNKILHGESSLCNALMSQRGSLHNKFSSYVYPRLPLERLLNPTYRDLQFSSKLSTDNRSYLVAVCGLWRLAIMKCDDRQDWDFTLNVDAGGYYRCHPEVIERDMISKYGRPNYAMWRSLVFADIASLEKLIAAVRRRIDFLVPSFTCCDRSVRLCERAGIPVHSGIAFLLPSKYE